MSTHDILCLGVFYPTGVSEIFTQRLKIFNQNFTRLLYVHVFAKAQKVLFTYLKL